MSDVKATINHDIMEKGTGTHQMANNATISTERKYTLAAKQSTQKPRGSIGKVGGATHPPLSWSKLDQASFGTCPTFHLASVKFEYSARQKCILSFGGDCIGRLIMT